MRILKIVLPCFFALTVAACSTTRIVESEVTTYSSMPAVTLQGNGYRFERLPSQKQQLAGQIRYEQMAAAVLAEAGMVLTEDHPRYSVQVNVGNRRLVREDNWYYGYPPGWWGWGFPYYGFYGPPGWWWGPPPLASQRVYYRIEVAMLMRDLHSGAIVYETHAESEDLLRVTPQNTEAVFRAALADFPLPSNGARSVRIEINKKPPQ